MLDEKRIKEAQTYIRGYLTEGLLRSVTPQPIIKGVLIKNSKESLRVAEIIFKDDISNLWTIVCSYYSMYYIANAVLYSIGYKVGSKISHKVTADALIVYVRGKLSKSMLEAYERTQQQALGIMGSDDIIESFDRERIKREKIQYQTTEETKYSKAQTSLERARQFLHEMQRLL